MIKIGVWRYKKRKDVPNERTLVGHRWVFRVKNNGVFRARLVALGYTQIPGIDHEDNFSPVINEVTMRTVLVAMLMYGWIAEIVDVKTAFLNGDLEEEIFMNIPKGLIYVKALTLMMKLIVLYW